MELFAILYDLTLLQIPFRFKIDYKFICNQKTNLSQCEQFVKDLKCDLFLPFYQQLVVVEQQKSNENMHASASFDQEKIGPIKESDEITESDFENTEIDHDLLSSWDLTDCKIYFAVTVKNEVVTDSKYTK